MNLKYRDNSLRRGLLYVAPVVAIALQISDARAWGERGHHLVGSLASKLAGDYAPDTAEGKIFRKFFFDRGIQLGHSSNIPDISWRDSLAHGRISYLNDPHHYFEPEAIVGVPGSDYKAFLQKVRELDTSYAVNLAKVDGKPSQLPGAPPEQKKEIHLYENIGVTPWRSQQLFDLMVKAFACAKSKESLPVDPDATKKPLEPPFRVPADIIGHAGEPELPSYVCDPAKNRRSDIQAAVLLGGVLSHFVGDQGQPYHPTTDYDGWVTGNGRIHSYFESKVVAALDLELEDDVMETARKRSFVRNTWEKIGADLKAPDGMVRLMFRLAADSHAHRAVVSRIDDEVAMKIGLGTNGQPVLLKSEKLDWGDHPSFHKDRVIKEAERLPAETPAVTKAFRPIIVERLAVSVVALARAWETAWELGGSPKLDGVGYLPYPLDIPFIWPDFDPGAMERSKKAIPKP